MATRLPPDAIDQILKLAETGYNKQEIATRTGLHYNTVDRYIKKANFGAVPTTSDAERALHDFGFFRTNYLGRVTLPWHIQAAEKIVQLLLSPEKEFLVMNVPPGAGKSTLLMDVCKWLICRNRAIRILYGTAVQSKAEEYTYEIMTDLTLETPIPAPSEQVLRGLAYDPQDTLQNAYGRFKPANRDWWTKSRFRVAQPDGLAARKKEPTVVGYGYDSGFLGGRYDLCVWDDLVNEKLMRTEDAREKLIRWWENTAETRCEPGGLVVLNGQRLGADDLYRHALDMLGVDEASLLSDDSVISEDAPKKYHHIIFPAHDETRCAGANITVKGKVSPNPDHALSAKPWPDGCLLDPVRLSWRDIVLYRRNDDNFQVVYQQQDIDAKNSLVKRVWIDGGTESDKSSIVTYPGCLDRDRMMWQVPKMDGQTTAFVTVDPSGKKNWSVQFWIYHHVTEHRFLIAHHRGPLTSPQFLDFNQLTLTHEGVIDDWWRKASALGHPFTHLIIENNAFQGYMLQSHAITTWVRKRNVQLVSHKTHGMNKADPEFGVRMLGPLYERGLIRLPYLGTEALHGSGYLINEVLKWPHGSFEDCVMSQWFGEHQLARFRRPDARVYRMRPDDYLSKKARRGLTA